jgi:hypothetical protein
MVRIHSREEGDPGTGTGLLTTLNERMSPLCEVTDTFRLCAVLTVCFALSAGSGVQFWARSVQPLG